MSAPIFNRADFQHPSDGWYQIEAKGEHPNRGSGVVQIIDDQAAQSIVNRFNADAAAGKLRHQNEMLIDHEHFSDQPDQETRAYGWLQELQNRSDGIYGRIKWTATGQAAVDGGDYRFFSTEYSPEDLKVLSSGKEPHVRPLRLDGLTLTNMNNNLGQKPITNRATPAAPAADPHPSDYTPGYPNPDTEAWFQAVSEMFTRLNKINPNAHLSWQKAEDMCRQQHPDLYQAHQGALAVDEQADDVDAKSAAEQASSLVNRIMTASGMKFTEAYAVARRGAPAIFNRASRASNRALNLPAAKPQSNDDTDKTNSEDRQRASRLFQKLVNEERAKCGNNYDVAYNRVRNRETALHSLVVGRFTGAQVFAVHPELLRKIYGS